MTNTGGSIIPAKEFEGKLWILADAFQLAMQAAYTGGVLAERENCAKLCEEMAEEADRDREPSSVVNYYRAKAAAIRARGQ